MWEPPESLEASRGGLTHCLSLLYNHYEGFEQCYEERFEGKYGFLRRVIGGVVRQYLTCGDLKNGFARVLYRAPLLYLLTTCG